MSPSLAAAIDIATDLAWRTHANVPTAEYGDRRELHARLIDRLATVRCPAAASPELRYLVKAMRRLAAATYSNRIGLPYYERREAVFQLRGCLVVWLRSVGRMA